MALKKRMILSHVNEPECKKAGLNTRLVEEIARDLERVGKRAARHGITIFGGSGHGTLRFHDGEGTPLIVGEVGGGNFDGGDGAYGLRDDTGLMRGE